MDKLLGPEQLGKFRQKVFSSRPKETIISMSCGTCAQVRGALKVAQAFEEAIKGLDEKISIKVTGCHGFCEAEPNVIIFPEEIFYKNLKPEDAKRIVKSTLEGKIVDDLIYKEDDNSFIKGDSCSAY